MSFKSQLVSMFGELGHFVSVLFQEALQQELVVVVPLARSLIAQVAMDPTLLTSSAKRGAVLAMLATQLVPKQVAVGEDVLRLAIELAYQDFKLAPPVATSTTPVVAPTTSTT